MIKRRKKPKKKEAKLQISCVGWFRRTIPKDKAILYSSLNGVRLSAGQSRNAKREGMTKGVPDLTLITANGITFIELKRPTTYRLSEKTGNLISNCDGGYLSKEQKEFRGSCKTFGITYHVCDNLDDFKIIIKKALHCV